MKEKEDFNTDFDSTTKDKNSLVVFNDNVNTFDWVIKCLVEVCQHDPIQAEQCATIIHYKNKCTVKSGDIDEILPKFNELSTRGLTVEIQ